MRRMMMVALALGAACSGAAAQTTQSDRAERAAFMAEISVYSEEHARHVRALTLAYVCRAREIEWFNRAMSMVSMRTIEDAERVGRGADSRIDYALAYFTGATAATRRATVAEQRRAPTLCDGAADAPHVIIYDGLVRQ